MKKAVVFDLDGTLLNTIGDLADACNYALKKYGLPLHNEEEYKNFVGWGIKKLVELSLPEDLREDKDLISKVLSDVADYYSTHWNRKTKPYEGIKDLLKKLNKEGIPIAVLSNKPQEFTEETVNYFFNDIDFFAIEGGKGQILKPDKLALTPVFEKLGSFNGKIFMVGDSKTDIQTAITGGLIPVGVSWGFRNVEELKEAGALHIINNIRELEELLLNEYA
jgi:phosphoglycolate phosphatase